MIDAKEIADRNAATSAAEVAEFRDTRPYVLAHVGYLSNDGKTITTWTGEKLADVTRIKRHKVSNSWVTDQRGSFWARGINGAIYHGRHNGGSMYCRMRLAVKQA